MWFKVAADLVVVIHLLFIGFVVAGVFLLVLLVATIGYRGLLRRHPFGRMPPQLWPVTIRHDHGTGGLRDSVKEDADARAGG